MRGLRTGQHLLERCRVDKVAVRFDDDGYAAGPGVFAELVHARGHARDDLLPRPIEFVSEDADVRRPQSRGQVNETAGVGNAFLPLGGVDRKSTRLNSSHVETSYAVFCLKKKKK